MIGTLNVGLDEAGSRSPIEEKLNLTSFIIILNLLWPVSRWIKEAFYCYPRGVDSFFFLRSMAFKLPHLLLFLSLKTSRKFQRANATALFVRCK